MCEWRRLKRSICIGLTVLLSMASSSFAATLLEETFVEFHYDFGPETGTVFWPAGPIGDGIGFSDLSLHRLSKGESYLVSQGPNPPLEYTLFGAWMRDSLHLFYQPQNPHLTFTVTAPSGYEVAAVANTFFLSIDPSNTTARFIYFDYSTEYSASQDISVQVDINTIPGSGGSPAVPLGNLSGALALRPLAIPEPSTAGLVGVSVAGVIVVFFSRRLKRADTRA